MTIKLAFKKDNPNLVFDIQEIERINVAGGVVEYYAGDLIDTSTVPDTRKAFKTQVMAFESEWVEVPVDLGSTGDINNQDKTVDPTTSKQIIKPDKGYTGISKVTVNAVTSDIDANIVAGNIKENVTILGVTGTLKEKHADMKNPAEIDLTYGDNDITLSKIITSIDAPIIIKHVEDNFFWDMGDSFKEYSGTVLDFTGSDFSKCSAFYDTFNGCENLTEIRGTLASAENTGISLERTFVNCKSLTSLNLRNIKNTNDNDVNLFLTFYGCTSLQHLDIGGLDLTHTTSFSSYTFGEGWSYVPLDCEIIVKDNDSKTALLTVQPGFTNVKTVAEYEA